MPPELPADLALTAAVCAAGLAEVAHHFRRKQITARLCADWSAACLGFGAFFYAVAYL
jgi:hypothetical protein